jgi:hypothetical protein
VAGAAAAAVDEGEEGEGDGDGSGAGGQSLYNLYKPMRLVEGYPHPDPVGAQLSMFLLFYPVDKEVDC